jgi:hypothetical protein
LIVLNFFIKLIRVVLPADLIVFWLERGEFFATRGLALFIGGVALLFVCVVPVAVVVVEQH